MMHVIDHLDWEWERLVGERRHRRTLRRWAEQEPVLDFPDLRALQARVERRDADRQETDAILAALASRAPHDTLAARVLLQLVLPGCKAILRRYRFIEREERAALVVAAAWDRIRTYPIEARPDKIAANIILDVRQRIWRGSTRRQVATVDLDAVPTGLLPAREEPAGSVGEVADLLAWAVRRGHLDREAARLVVLTRIAGVPVARIAAEQGVSEQTLRKRRLRAEARLREVLVA